MFRKHFYDVFMSVLAVVAVVLAVVDIKSGLLPFLYVVDYIILLLFVVDYFVRLFISSDKIVFIKNNIFDLVAIIPFISFFRAARLFRFLRFSHFSKLVRLLKFVRAAAELGRVLKRLDIFLKTNNFHYMLIASFVFISLGSALIYFVEEMSLADSVWWAFVTMTTVGYGDLSPSTSVGRFVAAVLMIFGIGLIGSLTSTITTYFFAEKNRIETNLSLKIKIIEDIKTQLNNIDDLTELDIDMISDVLKKLIKDKKK